VDGDDIRVVQPRQDAGFALKRSANATSAANDWGNSLRATKRFQPRLERFVNHAHAAMAHEFEYFKLWGRRRPPSRWAAGAFWSAGWPASVGVEDGSQEHLGHSPRGEFGGQRHLAFSDKRLAIGSIFHTASFLRKTAG